jgi:hypothetical protein
MLIRIDAGNQVFNIPKQQTWTMNVRQCIRGIPGQALDEATEGKNIGITAAFDLHGCTYSTSIDV